MKATARIACLFSGATLAFGLLVAAAPAANATGGHRDGHRDGGSRHRESSETRDWQQGKSTSDPDGDSNGGWDKPGHRGGFDDDRDGNNGCGNDSDREDDNNGWCGRHKARSEARNKVRSEAEVQAAKEFWAAKAATFRERAAEVKAKWLAALERCRDKAGLDDDEPLKTEVEGVAVSKKCDCDEADEVLSAAATSSTPVVKVEGKVETAPAPAPAATPADTSAAAAAAPATSVLGATEVAPAAAPTSTTPAPGTQVLGITETAPNALARTGAGLGLLALLGGLCLGGGRLMDLIHRRLGS